MNAPRLGFGLEQRQYQSDADEARDEARHRLAIRIAARGAVRCSHCNGEGVVSGVSCFADDRGSFGRRFESEPCDECCGEGVLPDDDEDARYERRTRETLPAPANDDDISNEYPWEAP